MQASPTYEQVCGLCSLSKTAVVALSTSSPTDKSGGRLQKVIARLNEDLEEASLIKTMLFDDYTNENANVSHRIVKRDEKTGLVRFLYLEKVDGTTRIIEENLTATLQDMADWLERYHNGEQIQWIILKQKPQ